MLPFMTQPTVAPACYVPKGDMAQSQIFGEGQYLTRTPAISGNTRKWSWAGWIAPLPNGAFQTLLSASVNANNFAHFLINPAGHLVWYERYANTTYWGWSTKAAYRDFAPFHVVLEYDTAAATPVADRLRIFVNGVRAAVDNTYGRAYGDDWDGIVNSAVEHRIGRNVASYSDYFSGLMASAAMVSGATPGPAAWGEHNIHGVWVPKPKSESHAAIVAAGGFGVTGCHLDFSDPLIPEKDISGQGNHWTAMGFDGTGKDMVASTPSNVYATFNSLDKQAAGVCSRGNLIFSGGAGVQSSGCRANMRVKGKVYFEFTQMSGNTNVFHGLIRKDANLGTWPINPSSTFVGIDTQTGNGLFGPAGHQFVTSAYPAGSILRFAVDEPGGKVWIGGKGGVFPSEGGWFSSTGDLTGDPVAGVNPTITVDLGQADWFPGVMYYRNDAGPTWYVLANFGQKAFSAAVPAGFKPLCTDNLPEPDIKDPAEAFAQATATGADIVAVLDAAAAHWNGQWVEIIKRRDASEDWRVRFSDDPGNSWATSTTSAKGPVAALAAGGAYVGYRLRVGARYGVYTAEVDHATGTATTVSHGLNTARNVVIATRVSVGGGSRYLRHPDMDAGKLMVMGSASPGCVGDASLTDFAANSFRIAASAPSGVYRVVVLAERRGLLSLTAHTGNGAADGAFVPTDVLPHLAMMVETTTSGGVRVWDAARAPGNPVAVSSTLTSAAMESSAGAVDFVVGGVKLRSSAAILNGSGTKYLGIVWGRPIGGVCVAPATAR